MNTLFVQLELDSMKLHVAQALAAREEDIAKTVSDLVEENLSGQAISAHVERVVERMIRQVLSEEIKNYFFAGKGRAFLKKTAIARLDRMLPDV